MKNLTMNNRAICSTSINRQIMRLSHQKKLFSTKVNGSAKRDDKVVAYYCAALAVTILGVAYASVPLYKVFCSMTGIEKLIINKALYRYLRRLAFLSSFQDDYHHHHIFE